MEGALVASGFAFCIWIYTLWYNSPPADFKLRSVLLLWYWGLFVGTCVAVNVCAFFATRVFRVFDWPPLRIAIPAVLLVGSQGFSYLWTHGIYFVEWNITSKYTALAIKALQSAFVFSIVGVVALCVLLTAYFLRKLEGKARLIVPGTFVFLALLGFQIPALSRPPGAVDLPSPHQGLSRPIVMIALDALTWRIMIPLMEQGELPNLTRLKAEGSWADLQTLNPTESPEIWTTMVTGVPPRVHGILHHTSFQFLGMREKMCFPHHTGLSHGFGAHLDRLGLIERGPVSSTMRRVPALWDIAGMFGKTSAVINWYASYPVEHINGVMVGNVSSS